ncbi:hypothetical protein Goshw_025710 [Gossypium schwendimanii]|uniref:Uncharacterized protein n=1 Tax=Gossypium schwendimanii TaxID=34291 RepID=A0A7J9M7I8_GOSSC|nr:hypothetical protein [Gossypium schwendimanii]
MGFNPPSMSFVLAVTVLNFMPKSSWDRKLDVYKKWGWSENEVIEAFRKNPSYMIVSEEKTVRRMDFLVKGMGFHLGYCQAPAYLLSKGLVKKELSVQALFEASEKSFIDKLVNRYKGDAHELLEVPIVDMWKKPTVGFPKLDVDAGRGRDGSCLGYSAILRDATGGFIAARSWAIYGGVRMFS